VAVVLVTGGSSGIGLATVRRLAAGGHRVFTASRQPTRVELPDGVTPLTFDVADPGSAEPAIASVVDAAGRIDALVNNAGTGTLAALEDTPDEEAHRIFEVNLFGPLRLARAAIAPMRAQGAGRIVNVTSMNDVLPAPFGGWYSASKSALFTASRVLDSEVARFGIRVSVVAPGLFRSEMTDALVTYTVDDASPYAATFHALIQQNAARLPTAGDPDDVAAAIETCITDETPPARVVVGDDARQMAQLVRDHDDESFAQLLRDFVAGLTP